MSKQDEILTVLPGAKSVKEIDYLLKCYEQSEEELDSILEADDHGDA